MNATEAPVPHDEVDDIVAAWHRVRPDIDVQPLHVLSRVGRLARHLDLARKTAFTQHKIDASGFDVLTALRRCGEPYHLSPGQLVTQTLVSSGTMTNRIDRLEDAGDVVRLRDPNDRRASIVELTEQGMRRVDAVMDDLLAAEQHVLDGLTATERDDLAGLLRRLLRQF